MSERWPILLVAAALMITGGWKALATEGASTSPHVLFGAGMLFGVGITMVAQWAALELRGRRETHKEE